jgi:hypothetical protein
MSRIQAKATAGDDGRIMGLGIGTWPVCLAMLVRALQLKSKTVSESSDALYDLLQDGPIIFAGVGAGGRGGHWVVFRGMYANVLWISDPRRDGPSTADYLSFMNQAPRSRLWICA